MILPKEAITEFKELYLENFGQDLSIEEATQKATSLLSGLFLLTKEGEEANNET